VAHAYNASYWGGGDQEDHDSKPAQANSLRDPISKSPLHTHTHTHTHRHTNRAGGVAQGEGPEFKTQYRGTKKKGRVI
jgi:hypothetical protein